jgi:hypothetical protein
MSAIGGDRRGALRRELWAGTVVWNVRCHLAGYGARMEGGRGEPICTAFVCLAAKRQLDRRAHE